MTDPISITSLMINLGKIIPHLLDYAKAVQDSRPDASTRLTEELFTLRGILEHVSAQIQPHEHRGLLPEPQELRLFIPS